MQRDDVIDWLMQGDPVIRWQAMRDLSHLPAEAWEAERHRTVEHGWCAQFIEGLRPDGTWSDGRWTGTVWTLLTLIDCGIPNTCPPVLDAAHRFLSHNLTRERALDEKWLLTQMDLCHLGFWLRIGAYFRFDPCLLTHLIGTVLRAQMPDGGWNCRVRNYPQTHHSSFHTTFNILEGLAAAADYGVLPQAALKECENKALEFMLQHKMYKSDKTGEVISERFTHLTFPSHWHYTVLRGLDYMSNCEQITDARLNSAIELVLSRRSVRGTWPNEKRIPGTTLFDMEKPGGDSRWNTLRAMRVLARRTMVRP